MPGLKVEKLITSESSSNRMPRARRRLTGLCLGAFFSSGVSAAEFPSEAAWFAEIPTLVTGTRLAQRPQDSPVSMTVIDREMIRASGALEIADLMRLVPGFQVSYVSGSWQAVTSHGLTNQDPRRLEVQVDGRSVYMPLSSTVDWQMLGVTLDDIERIEVVRGSDVPAYGSNALLGVINIITREPIADRGVSFAATAGSGDFGRAVVRYGGSAGALDHRLSLSYTESDGFDGVNDDVDVGAVSFRGSYQPTATDSFDIQLGYGTGARGLATDGSVTNPHRDWDATSHYQSIEWTRSLGPEEEISVHGYHNYYKAQDVHSLGLLSDILGVPPEWVPAILDGQPDQELIHAVYHGTAERYDLELQHLVRPGSNTRLVWGLGLRFDRLRAEWLLSRDDYIDDFGQRLFGNLEWRVSEDTVLNLGAMAENNEIAGFLFSPRIAANVRVAEGQALRASLTRSHRTFSLLETNFLYASRFEDGSALDYLIIADPDIEPEGLTTMELGYVADLAPLNLSLDVRLYWESLDDALGATREEDMLPVAWEDGTFLYGNFAEADTRGVDLQLSWRPDPRTLVALQYGYATSDGWVLRHRGGDATDDLSESVPRHTASLLLSRVFERDIQASAALYHVSDMCWLGNGDCLDEYTRLDLRLAKGFRWGRNSGEIAFLAHNLLDDYNEFVKTNLFESRYYLQARLDLD